MRWHKATWAFIIFNGLMLCWVTWYGVAAPEQCTTYAYQFTTCRPTGQGLGGIINLWLILFVVLGSLVLMTRPPVRGQ